MKVKLKKDINAYCEGELVYVQGKVVDADKRFAEELLATGKFEAVKPEKKEEKAEKENE